MGQWELSYLEDREKLMSRGCFFWNYCFVKRKKNVANLRARRVRNLKQSPIVFGGNATAGRGNSYSRFTNPLSPLATTRASPANWAGSTRLPAYKQALGLTSHGPCRSSFVLFLFLSSRSLKLPQQLGSEGRNPWQNPKKVCVGGTLGSRGYFFSCLIPDSSLSS